MVHVHHQVVALGQFAVESHPAAAGGGHLFVAPHEFALCDDHGLVVALHALHLHGEFLLVYFGLDDGFQLLLVFLAHFLGDAVLVGNQFLHRVGVHADKTALLLLLLQQVHPVGCQHAVHQQYVVTFGFGLGDIGVLLFGVVGIEVADVFVFVGLQCLDFVAVVIQAEILPFGVLQQGEL